MVDQKVKRILMTGGAGFIGANLVRMLLEHGYQMTVLDNLSTGRREYLEGLPVEFIEGDILDVDLVNRVVPGHDDVVHLAAQCGVPASLADPRRDCEVNVISTLNLLEACRRATDRGTKRQGDGEETLPSPPHPMSFSPLRESTGDYQRPLRFIFASSNATLGRQPPPATEDKAPLPISPYGASKLAGEAYCLAYHGSWGLGTVVLRFGNVYGPFSTYKNSVVAEFFKDMLTKGQITIDGDGQQTRDFIYVDDLCRAILQALESNVSGEVFQIATGVETAIVELASLVEHVVGHDIGLVHGPSRRGDIRRNYSDISKARRLLGWEPTTSLIDGLRHTWMWFASQAKR